MNSQDATAMIYAEDERGEEVFKGRKVPDVLESGVSKSCPQPDEFP